jgi:hypothetical protein
MKSRSHAACLLRINYGFRPMRNFASTVSMLLAASALGAQAAPPPILVRPTTITSIPGPESEWANDITGSPGARLIYYVTDARVRVYDRVKKTTTEVMKGNYTYIASSTAGDQLALVRPAEDSKPGPNRQEFVWTVSVNPQTGAATSEPRRVSMLPAATPRFSPDGRTIAFIATGNPRKMVVIPASGGVERVLFERGGPQGPVRWSPDGNWIYFSQPSGQDRKSVV